MLLEMDRVKRVIRVLPIQRTDYIVVPYSTYRVPYSFEEGVNRLLFIREVALFIYLFLEAGLAWSNGYFNAYYF